MSRQALKKMANSTTLPEEELNTINRVVQIVFPRTGKSGLVTLMPTHYLSRDLCEIFLRPAGLEPKVIIVSLKPEQVPTPEPACSREGVTHRVETA